MTATVQISAPLGLALRWWLRELAACAPAALRDTANRRLQTLIVIFGPDRARVQSGRAGKFTDLGEIELKGADRSTVRALLARCRVNLRRVLVVLKLPRAQVLRRRITLPLAASENLREIVGLELDRRTPLRAEDVYFDYKVTERDERSKRILVDIVVAPRAIADRAMEALKNWGLTPDRMSVADDDESDDEKMNLLAAPTSGGRRTYFMSRVNRVLGLIAVCLTATTIHLEIHRQHQILATYEERLVQQRAEGLEADKIKTQLADVIGSGRYVQQRRKDQPLLVALLDELTERVPDDVWLAQFRLQSGQLVLSGHARSASTLIGLLEESPMLGQVRFTSPVTPDPKLGLERFNLSASVAQVGGPQ